VWPARKGGPHSRHRSGDADVRPCWSAARLPRRPRESRRSARGIADLIVGIAEMRFQEPTGQFGQQSQIPPSPTARTSLCVARCDEASVERSGRRAPDQRRRSVRWQPRNTLAVVAPRHCQRPRRQVQTVTETESMIRAPRRCGAPPPLERRRQCSALRIASWSQPTTNVARHDEDR